MKLIVKVLLNGIYKLLDIIELIFRVEHSSPFNYKNSYISYLNTDAQNYILKALENTNKTRFCKETKSKKEKRRCKLWDKD